MRTELERMAAAQHGAFTSRQAASCYSKREIRTELEAGRWARLHKGVFCRACDASGLDCRLSAARLALDAPAVACLHTAAELHGFAVVDSPAVHVVDPGARHRARSLGLVLHQYAVPARHVVELRGHLATNAARTAIDVARSVPRPRALAVLDAALHASVVREELTEECERQAGQRGIIGIRALLPIADGRAESPMESYTRLILLDAELQPAVLQYEVRDGNWVRYRLDLAWPEQMVAVEYDGAQFHSGELALRRDLARHAWLDERGWRIVYACSDDVLRTPTNLIRRVALALSSHRRAA